MIKVSNLSKVFRTAEIETTALNGVSFEIKDGNKAVKREIRIGRQNPQYYEVLEGLEPGEKVITSGYDTYGDSDVLVF